jgi:hypothetical protein
MKDVIEPGKMLGNTAFAPICIAEQQ